MADGRVAESHAGVRPRQVDRSKGASARRRVRPAHRLAGSRGWRARARPSKRRSGGPTGTGRPTCGAGREHDSRCRRGHPHRQHFSNDNILFGLGNPDAHIAAGYTLSWFCGRGDYSPAGGRRPTSGALWPGTPSAPSPSPLVAHRHRDCTLASAASTRGRREMRTFTLGPRPASNGDEAGESLAADPSAST
jgi:hypothetical protein